MFSFFIRLLEPIWSNKIVYAKAVFRPILYNALFPIVIIEFTKYMTNLIVLDLGFARDLVSVFLFFLVGYTVINLLMRHRGWVIIDIPLNTWIQRRVLTIFLTIEPTHIEKFGTGKVQSILSKRIDKRYEMLAGIAYEVAPLVIFMLYSIWSLGAIHRGLSLAFLGIVIATVYLNLWLNTKAMQYRKVKYDISTILDGRFVKIIMSKNEILASKKIDHEFNRVQPRYHQVNILQHKQQTRLFLMYWIPGTMLELVRRGIFVRGAWSIGQGNANVVLFGSLILTLTYCKSQTDKLTDQVNDWAIQYIDLKKMRDFLDDAPHMEMGNDTLDRHFPYGDMVMQYLSFAYEKGKNIMTNFDLILPAGSVTALVGPSGGGKSTIMKILAGHIKPDSGSLMLGGNRLYDDIGLQSWFAHVGYLTQEPSVFDGTIRENLMYGMTDDEGKMTDDRRANLLDLPNKTNENINANENIDDNTNGNAKSVSLHDILQKSQCQFVYDLPNGLDTEIGERGVRLSGGQRQRLAIAKIMLKNPKIILLDEPTSALDSVSEELVSQAMQELFKDRTVVIIAHRLQTVKHADRILYIDAGQIVEEGKHDELLALGGKYAKMVEVQTGF